MQDRTEGKPAAPRRTTTDRKSPHLSMVLVLTSCIFCWISTSNAEERIQREFWIPGHGTLVLNIPLDWSEQTHQPRKRLPPTITLRPEEGTEFVVTILVLWSIDGEQQFNSDEKIRAMLESDRDGMLPNAVESELPLHPIKAIFAHGYYYSATDKAPKAGDPAHILRAEVATGNLLLSTTMLSRKKDSEAVQEVLLMLREAEHQRD
jgi:hypothetical protein